MELDELLGYEEIGGEEDDSYGAGAGYEEIGAVRRPMRRGPSRGPVRKTLLPPAASTMRSAGFQRMARKRVPLGLGTFTFTFSGAGAVTSTVLEVEPQRDYQAERLIIAVTKVVATEAVRVTSITIGDIEQLPGGLGVPAVMFQHDATFTGVDFSTAKAGTKIRVTIQLSDALETTETITVDAGFYGAVVGQ